MPEALLPRAAVGMRVLVPVGRRLETGYIVGLDSRQQMIMMIDGQKVFETQLGGEEDLKSLDQKQAPAAAFPAHWAPNDLKFYTGKVFPAAAQGGAFITFHGSWNRSVRSGYQVIFVPFADSAAMAEATLRLLTATDNVNAQSLYEAHGWVRDTQFYTYNCKLQD